MCGGGPGLGLVAERESDAEVLLSTSSSGLPDCPGMEVSRFTVIANDIPSLVCSGGLVLDLAVEMESDVEVVLPVSFSGPPDDLGV